MQTDSIVKIRELGKELNCTEASVRYIVNDLAKEKLLKRIHGGITRDDKTIGDISINILKTRNIEKKEYLTNLAIDFIKEDSTIILDSGTTNLILAKKIRNRFHNLNIITNSIKIADILIEDKNLKIIILGGFIRPVTYSIVNYNNESNLNNLKADTLFLNIGAVSLKDGLADPNLQEARIKRDMIDAANQVVLLADSSKFGKTALSLVCDLKMINKIITDNEIDDSFIKGCKDIGLEIVY